MSLHTSNVFSSLHPCPQEAGQAYNVRLEDVQSQAMQSGLRAATEGRLGEAERLFKIYLASEDPNSASAYSNLVSGDLCQQGVDS